MNFNLELKLKAFFVSILLITSFTYALAQNCQLIAGGDYDFAIVTYHSQQQVTESAIASSPKNLRTQLEIALRYAIKNQENTGFRFFVEGVDQQDFGITYSRKTLTYEFNELRFRDLTNLRKYILEWMLKMQKDIKVPPQHWKPSSNNIQYAYLGE